MGGAASKSTRRLPTTKPSVVRHLDPHPHPPPAHPPSSSIGQTTAAASSSEGSKSQSASAASLISSESQSNLQAGEDELQDMGRLGPQVHSSARFSGEKDDAIRRDALDPHFSSNLSQLGPVYVPPANHGPPEPSLAQRTLAARYAQAQAVNSPYSSQSTKTSENPGSTTRPQTQLEVEQLSRLLHILRTVKKQEEFNTACEAYGVDPKDLRELRQWTDIPSSS